MMLQNLIDELLATNDCWQLVFHWQVLKWKNHYQLITDYIYKINRFYGVILLSFLLSQLITFIACIFFLIMDYITSRQLNFEYIMAIQLLRTVTYLFLLTFVSHRVKQKVFNSET